MKKILIAFIALSGALSSFAQTDSSGQEKPDTIKVGGMIILKQHDTNGGSDEPEVTTDHYDGRHIPNIRTNWGIIDLGFANINDQSDYAAAQAEGFTGPGVGKDQFKFRGGKSVNVNIWFFMQQLNIINHVVNLKYGLGLELNNYRFNDERVHMQKNPTYIFIDQDLKGIRKNKLAADYATIPLMLDFNFTPWRQYGFGFSAGISAGYLYSSRQKFKIGDQKIKTHDDFDLEQFKLAYIAEISLGPVRLYGSYAFKSMWSKSLDQRPYAIGLRFSHW